MDPRSGLHVDSGRRSIGIISLNLARSTDVPPRFSLFSSDGLIFLNKDLGILCIGGDMVVQD